MGVQIVSRTSESVEVQSTAKERELPAIRAKFSRGFESSLGARPTAAYFTLIAVRDEYKSCCEALLLEKQYISALEEESEDLRAKVVDMEKSGAVENSILSKKTKEKTAYHCGETCCHT